MDHPNIVAYHDSFERDGILMIEMEYADGGNLQVEMSITSSIVRNRKPGLFFGQKFALLTNSELAENWVFGEIPWVFSVNPWVL